MTKLRRVSAAASLDRVIVVIADGVRSDVIPLLDLPTFGRLAASGASTLHGTTVTPSVTAAAMTSLLTGVSPQVHGLESDRFGIPRPRRTLDPLPAVLHAAGIRSAAWMSKLPWMYRRLASEIVQRVGFERATFAGDGASGVLDAARFDLLRRTPGLLLLHWPDADRAGHEYGWPSPAYLRAVKHLDRCLAELDDLSGVSTDPASLLIVMADHGGGGSRRLHHDSDHPLNRTIPLIMAGGRVRTKRLATASLLDVPATVLDALGVDVPVSYQGTSLLDLLPVRAKWTPRRDMQLTLPLAAAV